MPEGTNLLTLPYPTEAELADLDLYGWSRAAPGAQFRVRLSETGAVAGGGGGSAAAGVPVSAVSVTAYTFTTADAGTVKRFTNAGGCTATIPAGLAIPVGSVIQLDQVAAGAVTVAAGSGVTIQSRGGLLSTPAQYSSATLMKVGTDVYTFVLDIASGGVPATHGPEEWAPNFSAAGNVRIPARVAMTIAQGNAKIGAGTVTFEKSTAAAPGTFAAATLPVTLEAGAWLKVIASGECATHLVRTA